MWLPHCFHPTARCSVAVAWVCTLRYFSMGSYVVHPLTDTRVGRVVRRPAAGQYAVSGRAVFRSLLGKFRPGVPCWRIGPCAWASGATTTAATLLRSSRQLSSGLQWSVTRAVMLPLRPGMLLPRLQASIVCNECYHTT